MLWKAVYEKDGIWQMNLALADSFNNALELFYRADVPASGVGIKEATMDDYRPDIPIIVETSDDSVAVLSKHTREEFQKYIERKLL